MKASSAMRVEIAVAKALAERVVRAATFEAAAADLQTLRALHARTPSDALPLALSHLVDLLGSEDSRRKPLVEERQAAVEASRARDQSQRMNESAQRFVVMPRAYKPVVPRQAALALDSEAGWHLPPAFPGEWIELLSTDAEEAVDRVRAAFPEVWVEGVAERVRAVRRMPMACYPGFEALEVLFQLRDMSRFSQLVLLGATLAVWITGPVNAIHELNKLQDEDGKPYLDITTDDRAGEYIRFFCGAVHGPDGPFLVLRSDAELRTYLRPEAEYEVPEDTFAVAPMMRVEGEAKESAWQTEMTVLYANALFRTRFRLQKTGEIEMVEDRPLTQNLLVIRQAMGRGLRQVRGSG
jgi:hypothetical protein